MTAGFVYFFYKTVSLRWDTKCKRRTCLHKQNKNNFLLWYIKIQVHCSCFKSQAYPTKATRICASCLNNKRNASLLSFHWRLPVPEKRILYDPQGTASAAVHPLRWVMSKGMHNPHAHIWLVISGWSLSTPQITTSHIAPRWLVFCIVSSESSLAVYPGYSHRIRPTPEYHPRAL